jgi:hypothetical protein
MLEKLPDEMAGDPQIQQEIARIALAALVSSGLSALAGDGDAPQFVPSLGQLLNIGQPNADTIYRSAKLTPGARYRLRGKRGTINHTVISQVIPRNAPNAKARPHLRLSDLNVDSNGRYDVLIAVERPDGYEGDWWQLDPSATGLASRQVSSDWSTEESSTFTIERLDKPVGNPRAPAEDLEKRLYGLQKQTEFLALMFPDHVEQLRQEGYVNRLKVFDVGFGALAGQFYYEGAFDLADDEALIIESLVPARCQYRSLILTNDVFETIDWYNNHSSLNDAQALPDADGKLRIVVSARDPGVRNWLDTAGHRRGVVQGRWTECDSQPIPEARKVKVTEVTAFMPPDVAMVTPMERQQIIRERRRAYLERPQW